MQDLIYQQITKVEVLQDIRVYNRKTQEKCESTKEKIKEAVVFFKMYSDKLTEQLSKKFGILSLMELNEITESILKSETDELYRKAKVTQVNVCEIYTSVCKFEFGIAEGEETAIYELRVRKLR